MLLFTLRLQIRDYKSILTFVTGMLDAATKSGDVNGVLQWSTDKQRLELVIADLQRIYDRFSTEGCYLLNQHNRQ
ncbi:MAG: hypothetical protein H6550_16075 [Chitinophagales bacterium]|nr:hypothetical protein [Chitinophagales bacterium]